MKEENDGNLTLGSDQTNVQKTGDNITSPIKDVAGIILSSEVTKEEEAMGSAGKGLVTNDPEAGKEVKKLAYPKSACFVVADEFNRSFFYSAVRALLVLYLTRHLGLSDDTATIIFHTYLTTAYFVTIPGALISDSWLGTFKTIIYLSIILVAGATLITLSTIPVFNNAAIMLTIGGLVLVAMGAGMVSPCIAPFSGDQFKVPEQMKQLTTFFSLFYFFHNAGSLISFAIAPILREDVQCFGEKDCYFLGFGVASLLLVASLIIFFLASPLYVKKPPAGNMVAMVSKAIGNAISNKWKDKGTNPRQHWLDYADKKYDRQLLEDTKVLMRVLVLFLPLPLFWTLFEQQGSRWTIQATRMNAVVGSWNIKPDQMQFLSPLLFLAFVPVFDVVLYPLLSLFGIRRPLQKLTLGGILASMAFIISGFVELKLEQTYPTLPSEGIAQLRVYNGEVCAYSITTNLAGLQFDINTLDIYINKDINIESSNGINIQFQFTEKSGENCATLPDLNCFLKSEKSYYMFLNSKNATHPVVCAEDTIAKPSRGYPLGRTLANVSPSRNIQWKNSKGSIEHTEYPYQRNLKELQADTYQLLIDNVEIATVELELGGIYTALIVEELPNKYRSNIVIVTDSNSVSILWLLPQYVVMNLGQVPFVVAGTEFSYIEAPLSMKTVLQAVWLLTRSFGNLIVIFIAELPIFDSQASEFFLFAGLMFADMILFMFIAYLYKPNKPALKSEQEAQIQSKLAEQSDTKNVANTIDESRKSGEISTYHK